ncbi:CYTH domain-containing protein [Paraglaciecola sp.]|uniref:CYTH domain-containing protein n=1 Tax=Paraglaciecola sp. TaxID=1920173 RepID=UPI0030F37089
MEYEIELKLSTTGQAGALIESHLLPELAASVEQRELELTNSYFDTSLRDFRKNGMGLRIRGCQQTFEQTLKTAGRGVAGLQQRPEYNVALGEKLHIAPALPDLSLFPAEVWPTGFAVDKAQTQLQCLFVTHFTRSVYLLTFNKHSQIELVWDRGSVRANDKQETINEIELELKQGNVSELFALARQLAAFMPLKIGLLSKAARGYRLLKTTTKPDTPLAEPVLSESMVNTAPLADIHGYMAKYLSRWQHLINQFEVAPDEKIFSELATLWQQLCLLLEKCCQGNQTNIAQLTADTQCFKDEWRVLLQKNIKGCESRSDGSNWSAAVDLLTGSTVMLLQLAIMQYLVEHQALRS